MLPLVLAEVPFVLHYQMKHAVHWIHSNVQHSVQHSEEHNINVCAAECLVRCCFCMTIADFIDVLALVIVMHWNPVRCSTQMHTTSKHAQKLAAQGLPTVP